jgi:hypothetical protein
VEIPEARRTLANLDSPSVCVTSSGTLVQKSCRCLRAFPEPPLTFRNEICPSPYSKIYRKMFYTLEVLESLFVRHEMCSSYRREPRYEPDQFIGSNQPGVESSRLRGRQAEVHWHLTCCPSTSPTCCYLHTNIGSCLQLHE